MTGRTAPPGRDDLVLTPRGLRFHGRILPCTIGRSGLAGPRRIGTGTSSAHSAEATGRVGSNDRSGPPGDTGAKGGASPNDEKHEGDGATPRGIHRITGLLYRPDRRGRPDRGIRPETGAQHVISGCSCRVGRTGPGRCGGDWAIAIRPSDMWSDDPADPDYNRKVHAATDQARRFSHEALRRPDPLYDLVLLTDWNTSPARPGRGSAIFVHRWRKPGHPTEGCIALAPTSLRWLVRRIGPGTRLIVP